MWKVPVTLETAPSSVSRAAPRPAWVPRFPVERRDDWFCVALEAACVTLTITGLVPTAPPGGLGRVCLPAGGGGLLGRLGSQCHFREGTQTDGGGDIRVPASLLSSVAPGGGTWPWEQLGVAEGRGRHAGTGQRLRPRGAQPRPTLGVRRAFRTGCPCAGSAVSTRVAPGRELGWARALHVPSGDRTDGETQRTRTTSPTAAGTRMAPGPGRLFRAKVTVEVQGPSEGPGRGAEGGAPG